MTFRMHALLLLIGAKFSGAIDLLLEGADAWKTPSRVKRCPAHSEVTAQNSADGPGVEFVGTRKERFSLTEKEVSEGRLASFDGLQLRFVGAPPAWTLRLGQKNSKTRYITVLDGTAEQSVFIPWGAFKGQSLHVGHIDYNGKNVDAEQVRTISAMLPGIQSGLGVGSQKNFILRELVAAPFPQGVDPASTVPAYLNSAGELSLNAEPQCSCDFACGRCAIIKHLSSGICSTSQYADLCLVSGGGLMRRLAAGFSSETCTSEKAVHTRHWLQVPQYIEKCLPGHSDAVGFVIHDLMQGLLQTHFNADSSQGIACESAASATNLTGFVGPFVAMGITGYNDLGSKRGVTVGTCLELCRQNPKCRSIDYGARDKVMGECWLSTANRESAGDAYSPWTLYDYYEVSDDDNAAISGAQSMQNASTQASSIPVDQQSTLLEAAGLNEIDCCKQPSSCIKNAISVGVQKYNSGDPLSCFFIYHAAAERIGQCGDGAALDYQLFLKVAALAGASNPSANSAAWVLRRAFDIVVAVKAGKCGEGFPPEDDVLAPSPSAGTPAAGTPAAAASTELVGDLADYFDGPFKGMGISGANDLTMFQGKSAEACLEECLKNTRCKSVDYGARGGAAGECWLSTADRASAGSAFSAWELYDYYERKLPNEEGPSPSPSSQPEEVSFVVDQSTDEKGSQPDDTLDTASSADRSIHVSGSGIAMLLLPLMWTLQNLS